MLIMRSQTAIFVAFVVITLSCGYAGAEWHDSGAILLASSEEANVTLTSHGSPHEVAERKSVDDADTLYSSWMEFLTIRSNQSTDFNEQFPVDGRLYGNVRACGRPLSTAQKEDFDSVDTLAPEMIEIYAEIGHLSTFCAGENPPRYGTFDLKSFFTQLDETEHVMQASKEAAHTAFNLHKLAGEFAKSCVSSLQSASSQPSFARILQAAGANRLEVFEGIAAHGSLQSWTRSIIDLITRSENYNKRWKFILLTPGISDIPLGGTTAQLVDDVTQSLELIHHRLPIRTYVVVLRDAGFNFWRVVDSRYSFCEKIHSLWRFNATAGADKWRTLQSRIESNYQAYNDFYVHAVDMMEGAVPIYSRDRGLDVSVLSADCTHLSSRGISLLHTHLWNRLVQAPTRHSHRQRSERGAHRIHSHHRRRLRHHRSTKNVTYHTYSHAPLSRQSNILAHSVDGDVWTPLVRALFCPRPKCPYLITERNRKFCTRIAQLRYNSVKFLTETNGGTTRWSDLNADFSQWSIQPTILALLALSVMLYTALAFYIFCMR